MDALPRPTLDIEIPAINPSSCPTASSGSREVAHSAIAIPRHCTARSCTEDEGSVSQTASSTSHETPFFDLTDGTAEVVPISAKASAAPIESQQRLKMMKMVQPYTGIVWPYCDR